MIDLNFPKPTISSRNQ